MKLRHPPAETEWLIVESFLVDHPTHLYCDTLAELRSQIAALARGANRLREPKRRIKSLQFQYSADDQDMVTEVRVFFTGYARNKIRFMKLVRTPYAS